jgi:hypothetical protein
MITSLEPGKKISFAWAVRTVKAERKFFYDYKISGTLSNG